MTTTTVKDCPTCQHRKAGVYANERAVGALARQLVNAQNADVAPHRVRGINTQLEKAKATLKMSKQLLEEHQYGECGA